MCLYYGLNEWNVKCVCICRRRRPPAYLNVCACVCVLVCACVFASLCICIFEYVGVCVLHTERINKGCAVDFCNWRSSSNENQQQQTQQLLEFEVRCSNKKRKEKEIWIFGCWRKKTTHNNCNGAKFITVI